MTTAIWFCGAVTVVSAGVSAGFAVAGARGASGAAPSGSLYALARSAALLIVALVALFVHTTGFIASVALAMVLVQAFDAVVGVVLRDRVKTVGPAVLAVVNLVVLVWLLARS